MNKYRKRQPDYVGMAVVGSLFIMAPFAWFAAAMIGKTLAGA